MTKENKNADFEMTKELQRLSKKVIVKWSYEAVPKPIYACRMWHEPTKSYIHTVSRDQRQGWTNALHLINEQIKNK
jgi:hypothetical protein